MRVGFWGVLLACAAAAACAGVSPSKSHSNAQSYANFLIGRVADLRQDHRAASDRLYSALQLTPDDATLAEEAMTSTLAIGDLERARDIADTARRHDLDIAYAHLLDGVDALSARRYRRARAVFGESQGASAEEITERILSAWVDAGAHRAVQASADLGLVSAPRPYSGLFLYTRAMVLDADGEDEAANALYEAAVQSGFWLTPVAVRYAERLANAGKFEDSAELLRARAGWFGDSAQTAALQRIAAEHAAGAGTATERLSVQQGAALSLFGLGVIFLDENDVTHGLATLTLALALDPELDAARIAFASAQINHGREDEARPFLEAVGQNSPYFESARALRATLALRDGDEDSAIAIVRASVDEDGGVAAQRRLADLYRNVENFAASEPIYTELIEASGDDVDWRLYFFRAVVRERLDRWPDAEADLLRALEIEPNQPDVLNYLGYTWIDREERIEEGLALIERAVAARPASGAIIDSLGWAHYKLGDYERALRELERAVSLEPADPILNDHLGDVYWRLGRRIEARFQWQRAISLGASETDASNIEAKLEHGLAPPVETHSANR